MTGECLPADIWTALEQTYVGAGIADNWEALARTMALFRQLGIEVGTHLGYTYPDALHHRVRAYVEQIKQLPTRRSDAAYDAAMIDTFDG
jgi:aminoglycoside 6-adenylyltransferase